jgi:hypothetical protein
VPLPANLAFSGRGTIENRKTSRRSPRADTSDSRELAIASAYVSPVPGLDERITERGWVFDEELSDEESVLWSFPPSEAEVPDEDVVPVTTIALTSDESGELAHVVFVGTADDYQFEVDELFDHLDVIESYRLGDPFPEVGS